jgi:hypothetical protein
MNSAPCHADLRTDLYLQVSLSNRNLTLHSVPPPGSGVIMAYILNMLDLYNMTTGDEGPLLYHRSVISACSFLCGKHPQYDGLIQHGEGDVTIRPRMYLP